MDMTVLETLPTKLRDGDLAWLQTQYDMGALDAVGQAVTTDQWATVGTALHAGDLETVRLVLSDVQIDGVGPVVLPPRKNRAWIIAGAVVAALAVIGLVIWLVTRGDDDTTSDIPSTLADDPDYSTLSDLLNASPLAELLAGDGPFTMFAPNNQAFAAIPADQLSGITANPAALEQLLNYLVVADKTALTTDELQPGAIATLEGSAVAITKEGDATRVNAATVVDPNIE